MDDTKVHPLTYHQAMGMDEGMEAGSGDVPGLVKLVFGGAAIAYWVQKVIRENSEKLYDPKRQWYRIQHVLSGLLFLRNFPSSLNENMNLLG